MSLIDISRLTFGYDCAMEPIFKNLSLQLDTRWKLGLIGRNGRGKTTFLRLLAGELPYQGRISAGVDFERFPYAIPDEQLTPEQIREELVPQAQTWQLYRELHLLGMDADGLCHRPFCTLSEGERSKVLLALLFLRENAYPLLDEPTNHLDQQARQTVAQYLQQKTGFLLVSHDRTLLDACTDHILAMQPGGLQLQRGNFSSWYENKQRQDHMELQEQEKLQREVRRLSQAAQQVSNWANQAERGKYACSNSGLRPDRGYVGHKAAKVMKRSTVIRHRRQEALEKAQSLLKHVEHVEPLKLLGEEYRSSKILELKDVTVSYTGTPVCKPVCLSLFRGERVALTGPNGCGKSSILKVAMGKDLPFSGQRFLPKDVKIAYVPQDVTHLQGSFQNLAEKQGVSETQLKTILRKLDFSRGELEQDLSRLSLGQKKKAALACSLCQRAHLYVWDEPLNYVDVFSRMQLEQLILDFLPTLLFVEHDRSFRTKVATRELLLSR